MSKRGKDTGELKRTTTCNFCGGEHRRHSRELRECRKRHRRGQSPASTPPVAGPQAKPSSPGSEVTRYLNDPLRGDKRAHTIARKLRSGLSPRKVAKHLNLPLAEVEAVAMRLRR